MIALITDENRLDFIKACLFDEIHGARICTLNECYWPDTSILLLWLQTDDKNSPTAAVSLFSGCLTLSAAAGADIDELADFARAVGGFKSLEASAIVCKELKLGGEYAEFNVMRYAKGRFDGELGIVCENPPVREIYDILCRADPPFGKTADFAGWYTHTSHLFRHGLGFAGLILKDDNPVSTGGVYAMGDNPAVISCVATLPDFRGRGYATKIIKYLANKILDTGKTPVLLCEDGRLAGYYARLGFSDEGRCGRIVNAL